MGADARDGKGPLVLHYEEGSWERLETGRTEGELWWVFGFDDGPVFMGGERGLILRYQDGVFTEQETPGTGTVFGIWGSSSEDLWAVGGGSESGGGFAWRLQGDTWVAEPSLPPEVAGTGALWKIHGTSANDAWLVGSNGLAFHWDGQALQSRRTGVGSSLFTVVGSGEHYVAVGGSPTGIILEYDGSSWTNATPDSLPDSLAGVSLAPDGKAFAVGWYGGVLAREPSGAWRNEDLGFGLEASLHAVWIDPQGGVWAVGGQTVSRPLTAGVLIHKGPPVPPLP